MKPVTFVVSCEHAGNIVPKPYQDLFSRDVEVLNTHRAWDPGSLALGKNAAHFLKAPLFKTEVSRLLIECNRSVDHALLFSEFSNKLSASQKKSLLEQYYYPYRNEVEEYLQKTTQQHTVIHLSMHSFTPVWDGLERKTDIGLLFDAKRHTESKFCSTWQLDSQAKLPDYCIALNDPYNGADDGFTTYLRKIFDASCYLGIEVEINQKWVGTPQLNFLTDALLSSVIAVTIDFEGSPS